MKKALLLIVFIALILRTNQIAQNPPSLSWDEVSIGYNAYSILKSGQDEHGRFLPLDTFASYGDYKPPLAIYATVPFVAVLGLNELAVRLPSALFGTLTVLLSYFLVQELFRKSRFTDHISLITCILLAFSPWHINLSRGGFEANIALSFAVLGVWLVLKARDYPKYWLYAWLPFVAAIYTFNSSRVFVILLVPVLVLFTQKNIKKNIRTFSAGVLIAAICMAPILPHLLSKEARLRFNEVNIFTDLSVIDTSNARIAREPGSIIGKLVNNRRVGYARSFLLHFMDNLRPEFLFVTGDGNPKFSIQDVGQLYMIEAPFLAIGIVALFIEYPGVAVFLLYWLIAAVIPAATARETPHALRILNSLPTWQIFIAYGIMKSIKKLPKILPGVLILAYAFSIVYYLHTYYVHYPIEYSGEWQYGYKQAIEAIKPIESNYDHVFITDSIGRPYMYTLFYEKTDPKDLFRTVRSYFDAAGFYHVDGFLKYEFRGKLPAALDAKTLYVWDAGAVPAGARVIQTIKLLNGNPVLTIFTV
jgi:4-amino-4-deoxy-L-arabinose transferase-like glycosyltransferase